MPLFQGFCPVAGTICPSLAAAVVGPSRAPQGMKKGRRPRRRPRLKLSDKAGPDQCPVPGENALFPAQIAGFLAVSRAVPVYPVFLNYVVPVHSFWSVLETRMYPYRFPLTSLLPFCPASHVPLPRITKTSCPRTPGTAGFFPFFVLAGSGGSAPPPPNSLQDRLLLFQPFSLPSDKAVPFWGFLSILPKRRLRFP